MLTRQLAEIASGLGITNWEKYLNQRLDKITKRFPDIPRDSIIIDYNYSNDKGKFYTFFGKYIVIVSVKLLLTSEDNPLIINANSFIFDPLKSIDYVITHELIHVNLYHKYGNEDINHKDKFQDLHQKIFDDTYYGSEITVWDYWPFNIFKQ